MKLYLKVGGIYVALVLGLNLAFDFSWQTFGNFWFVAAIVCLPAILVSLLVRVVPQKIFDPNNKIFSAKKGEHKLYERLKVKKWKASIPEAGKLSGFKKDHIQSPKDPEYLRKFLIESCIAEAIHAVSIIWSLVSLLFVPRNLLLPLGIPLFFLSFFVHIFPVLIQRYIRPRILRILNAVLEREEKEKQMSLDDFNKELAEQKETIIEASQKENTEGDTNEQKVKP